MNRLLLAAALIALMFPDQSRANADGPEPPKVAMPQGTTAERVAALIAQHRKASDAFQKVFEAAKSEKEQEKLFESYPDPQPYSDLLLQIAEQNPNDPAAIDALIWAHRYGRSDKAKAILMRDHLLHPMIGPFCMTIRTDFDLEAMKVLRKVLSDNPAIEARGYASVGLASYLKSHAGLAAAVQKADAKRLLEMEEQFGKDLVAVLRKADAAAVNKEVEELMDRISKDKNLAQTTIIYHDQKVTVGEWADSELFEIRHLQPGMVVPDIVGEDIDAKAMKLSDFRGKVVLLEFWGFW